LKLRAAERAASHRQAADAAAAAAATEEERLKQLSLEPIVTSPEVHQAKQRMHNRRRSRV